MEEAKRFEEMFHHHKEDVHNFLLYYMMNVDVNDVLQETFVKALKVLHDHANVLNERSWLIAMARNAAIDYYRREKKQKQKLSAYTTSQIQKEKEQVETKLHLSERERILLDAIYRMKKSYLEVTILRGFKEFTVPETAKILNWSENKVRVTYHRGLKKLKEILSQGGGRSESL